MKRYFMRLFQFLLLAAILIACLMVAEYLTAPLFGAKISAYAAVRQAVSSTAGLFIFALLLFLLYMIRHCIVHHMLHNEAHGTSHHALLNEIEEALNRISRGDFEIQIDQEKNGDARYYNKHISDLADKINNMAQQLNGMETMRQDFVSNVSHEIQSPLTSIKGFVSLLKDDGLSRDEQLHYIGIIESESLRLSKLGESLLRLSSLESEFVKTNPKAYSLSGQLNDVILLLEPQWSAKNIEISLSEEPTAVFADEDMLSQVWINLLNNSIKFTNDGGKIIVSVSNQDTQTEVRISDNGIGMTEETVTHIFERFYMADKARSRSAGGSGLGLSIVKRIVQMHSGRIDVKSGLGEGTTFTVTLPKNIMPV